MSMKQVFIDSVKVLVLLLDDAVVIAAVLVTLHFFNIEIPLPLMIVLGVIAGAFVVVRHVKVIPSFHRRKVTGREGMVGEGGEAILPLNPSGRIMIKDEIWKAESVNGNIEKGSHVEVVAVNGLTLKVRHREDERR